MRVREPLLDGIFGRLYRPGRPLPVPATEVTRLYESPDVRWVLASQLVATLTGGCTVESAWAPHPSPTTGTRPLTHRCHTRSKEKEPMTTPNPAHVTPREKQLLILVAQGKKNQEIAEALFLAPSSVRTYLVSLRRKLGVYGHRAALARVAFRDRHVDPGTSEGQAPTLSDGEQRLLRDAAAGLTLTEIAEQTGQSYDQVKARMAQLLSKLGAEDRFDAMRICEQHRLLHETASGSGPADPARTGRAA
ncbi:LuxR C-terminal-related transcriptional regulator [Streptomyces sp. NPDC018019]|uniref:helix-turn-helix domain-containing protein n=1 Tax=Streptomyces sp. NPDC018019 TaxID=3365030 RepID=UPI003798F948